MNHYSTGFAITLLLCSYTVTVHGDCFKVTKFNSMDRTCEKITDHAQCVKYSDWGVFETEEDCCGRLTDGCTYPTCGFPVHKWVIGATGISCTDACSSEGLTCETFAVPETEAQGQCIFEAVGEGVTCTDSIYMGSEDFNPSVESSCYWGSGSGECGISSSGTRRVCGCSA